MIWSSSRPAVHRGAAVPQAVRWTPVELHPFELPTGTELVPEPLSPEDAARAEVEAAERARAEAEAAEHARAEAQAAEFRRAVAEAYQRGYEEGRAEGEMAEAARLANPVRAAERALGELRAGEERWTGNIEENLCALAVAVARQVIGRELETGPEAVAELVRRALAEFPLDQPIRIRVNPQDLEALNAASGIDPLAVVGEREAAWVPDAVIAPGGCVVEGRDRIVDGRVDTALERVYRRLTYTHA